MSQFLRRPLPLFIMSFLSTLVLLEFFVSVPFLTDATRTLSLWATIISGFILVVGVVNVVQYNYAVFKRREPKRWYFGAYVILLLTLLLVYGVAVGGAYAPEFEWYWFHLNAWPYFATLGVQTLYQFSSAYRAFRARSIEAALLLIGAFVAVLGYAPLTAALFPSITGVASWMASNPAAAATRGITIGAGVGALALGFRVLLGREKQIG